MRRKPGYELDLTAVFRSLARRALLSLLLLQAAGAALFARPAAAQADPDPPGAEAAGELELGGRIELRELVARVSRATGRRFLIDDALRGEVTLLAEGRIDAREALEILHAALLLSGFAAVPTPGGGFKVLPVRDAAGSVALRAADPAHGSEQLITALLHMDAVPAAEIASVLRPLLGERAQLVAYAPTNSLIVAAAETQLLRLIGLVRALDHASSRQRAVIQLHHADAEATAEQLLEVFDKERDTAAAPRVIPDPRTRSLILVGSPEQLEQLRALIRSIDRPVRSSSNLHVVRVLDANAGELAERLLALRGQTASEPDAALAEQLPASYDVVADGPTNSLVIRAEPAAFASLSSLIEELDQIPARVAIDVTFIEAQLASSLALGFDAFLPLTNADELGDTIAFTSVGNAAQLQSASLPNTPFIARITRNPLLVPILGPGGIPTTVLIPQGGAEIVASEGDAQLRTLLSPHLLAASGEEQRLVVGDRVPIPVSSAQTDSGGSFQTSVAIQQQDVGVELRVKPIVLSRRSVQLDLQLTFSAIGADASGLNSSSGPTIDQRKLEAVVRLSDGSVAVIGSSPQPRLLSGEASVPYLADVPILGHFFRTRIESERNSVLLIVVQATAIGSLAAQTSDSVQRRLAFERQLLRTSPLRQLTDEPYALLVATRQTWAQARAIADLLRASHPRVQVVEWRLDDRAQFDVYLYGFAEPSAMAAVATSLRELGFQPRLSVAHESLSVPGS